MTNATCDVVVIGSGAAGLASAVAAATLGLDCVVLEKAPLLGGGTAISAGFLWVGANHLNPDPNSDSAAETLAYLRAVGSDGIDAARMLAFAEQAPLALRFFEGQGIPFRITARRDHYDGVAPGAKPGGRIVETPVIDAGELGALRDAVAIPAGPLFRLGGEELARLGGPNSTAAWDNAITLERDRPYLRGGGTGLVTWLLRAAQRLGVRFVTSAAAERLLMTDGHVTGVAMRDGQHFIARHGVVLASGGYESNAALVRNYEALPGWQSMFPSSLTGDGLVMAAEIGAATRVVPNNLSVFLGFRNTDDAPGDVAPCRLSANQELVAPHTMVVNRAGRRFVDETFFQAVAPRLRDFDMRTRTHANLPCYLIFDAQYVRRNSFAGRAPGAPIPDWVVRSDSLAGLADAIGVDGAQLAATVAAFNADAWAGRDRAFGRGEAPWGLTRINPAATLGSVVEPPYYAIELHPTALGSAGLVADAAARVMHVRGGAISGLYAVGNVAARTETGSGYQTGYSLASALTFGLIAARDMVSADKKFT